MSITLAVSYFLSGFFMKTSDDEFDEKKNVSVACLLGVICGVFAGYATIVNADACVIFIAILIGNVFAFKVDGVHHILTLAVFAIICLIFGIPPVNFIALIVCIITALLDELGHERIILYTKNIYINLFFEYRCLMKVAVLFLGIFGLFDIWTFLYFILFEVSYEFAGYINKLNQ